MDVLDACSFPGNKTGHLAAVMKGKGRIIACEHNKDRINRLEETIRLSGTVIILFHSSISFYLVHIWKLSRHV